MGGIGAKKQDVKAPAGTPDIVIGQSSICPVALETLQEDRTEASDTRSFCPVVLEAMQRSAQGAPDIRSCHRTCPVRWQVMSDGLWPAATKSTGHSAMSGGEQRTCPMSILRILTLSVPHRTDGLLCPMVHRTMSDAFYEGTST